MSLESPMYMKLQSLTPWMIALVESLEGLYQLIIKIQKHISLVSGNDLDDQKIAEFELTVDRNNPSTICNQSADDVEQSSIHPFSPRIQN